MDKGVERAAALLMCLGEEVAGGVLACLEPNEVRELLDAMHLVGGLPDARLDAVFQRFLADMRAQTPTAAVPGAFARRALERARQQGAPARDDSGVDALRWLDARSVAALLGDEHPQIVAVALSRLEPRHAAQVLACMPAGDRAALIERVASLDDIWLDSWRDLEEALARKLTTSAPVRAGGLDVAARIVGNLQSDERELAMAALAEGQPMLARQIDDRLVSFESLMSLADAELRLLLAEIGDDSLLVALKGAGDALRARIASNLQQDAAQLFQDAFEARGAVPVAEVELAQNAVVGHLRRLIASGRVSLTPAV
jgi:flagellar motor switch protein FliG